MTLLKINLKAKTKTQFIIRIEEKTWGVLPRGILQVFLNPNDEETEITTEQFIEIRKEITKFSWNRLLDYLAYRERSVLECRNFLRSIFLDEDVINTLIEKAETFNYLKDRRFAELFMESLIEKNKSSREITNKLRIKGIENTIIEELLEQYYREKEDEIIRNNINKSILRYKRFSQKERKEKIVAYLARKGFSYYKILDSLDNFEGE